MAHTLVERFIQQHLVAIFSKSFCPYCSRVKDLFQTLGVPYQALELDQTNEMEAIQDVLEKKTGGRSVPRVFLKAQFLGGSDDMAQMHDLGELIPKLRGAGVPFRAKEKSAL